MGLRREGTFVVLHIETLKIIDFYIFFFFLLFFWVCAHAKTRSCLCIAFMKNGSKFVIVTRWCWCAVAEMPSSFPWWTAAPVSLPASSSSLSSALWPTRPAPKSKTLSLKVSYGFHFESAWAVSRDTDTAATLQCWYVLHSYRGCRGLDRHGCEKDSLEIVTVSCTF